MLLNDVVIDELAKEGMITPYIDHSMNVVNGHTALSFGLSSFGYDVRIGETIKMFHPSRGGLVDPKRPNKSNFKTLTVKTTAAGERYVILPPHSYVLGHTLETFDIPRDIMVVAVGKSTAARAGLEVNVTPIEAGFKGQVVIEISNATPLDCMLYVNEGIAQFLFYRGEPCKVSYGDRNGKYQNQTGVELGRC